MEYLFTLAVSYLLSFFLMMWGSIILFIVATSQKRRKIFWFINSFVIEFGLFFFSVYLFFYHFAPYNEKNPELQKQLFPLGLVLVFLPVIHAGISILYLIIKKRLKTKELR